VICVVGLLLAATTVGQLVDKTRTNLSANDVAINKSFEDEIGAGRGDSTTDNSSLFIINRDPFRAIRRGRQLFQRKFARLQGQGPLTGDGQGNVATNLALGAGSADSCAACHGRPRGAAGFGGDVATRPDSRDAPHLFGLGLKEMLADEITTDLRAIRSSALAQAVSSGQTVVKPLVSKGIQYGSITALPNGTLDTSGVQGVNPDLRVRPFFAHGGTISIREFIVGALNDEMGLQAIDADLIAVKQGQSIVTPGGMILNPALDSIKAPPVASATDDPDGDAKVNEIPTSIVDFLEFYLLNYFKPGRYEQTPETDHGLRLFQQAGCNSCHIQNLQINRDRRVADVETQYDPANGILNTLFATATTRFITVVDNPALPSLKQPALQPFLVTNIFTDFKRHDLGPNFWERNYDGTLQKEFLTTPLWGVGTSAPYGHDGRSISIEQVILRHGGEAQTTRDNFEHLSASNREALIGYLNTLILFPPDDTASNLDPGNRAATNFPQAGHGSIKLGVLFNVPSDPE